MASCDTSSDQCVLDLQAKFPGSNALKHARIRNASNTSELSLLLKPYFLESLRKGVPSLFNSVRDMYGAAWRADTIEQTLLQISGHADEPTVQLWSLYVLSQHYSARGDSRSALACIESAIEHTPTLVELYMQKARVL